jgi:rhodanese-related sulfurtransferase
MRALAFICAAFVCSFVLAPVRAEDVSLGVVYQGEETAFELPCANSGKRAIWVAEAVSSCDCLKARFAPVPVDPGKTVRLEFVYRAAVAGRFSVEVQLRGAEPAAILGTHTVTGFVADKAWLLPVAQLPNPGPAQKAVVIDTRPAGRFARMHIPRSLNLPAYAIKSRTDLRERQLVLVDEGFAPGLLLEAAAGLRHQGFRQVEVLDGGLAEWARQGRATEGTESTSLAVASLSVSDFMRTRRSVEWRALELKGQTTGAGLLESAVEVDRPENLAGVLRSLGHAAAGRQAPRILVVAPDQATCARIEAQFGATNPAPIFFLMGGQSALVAYQGEQALLAQQTHELIQIRPGRGHPLAAGGCNTCPKSAGR